VLVTIVLAALAAVMVGSVAGGHASTDHLRGLGVASVRGVLESAGLLCFAFAGYARIATLGEEVTDPERTIPKAIPRALGITLLVSRRRRGHGVARRRPQRARRLGRSAQYRGAKRIHGLAQPCRSRWGNDRSDRSAAFPHRRSEPDCVCHGGRRRSAPLARCRAPGPQSASPR
jgi:hypothetical protein